MLNLCRFHGIGLKIQDRLIDHINFTFNTFHGQVLASTRASAESLVLCSAVVADGSLGLPMCEPRAPLLHRVSNLCNLYHAQDRNQILSMLPSHLRGVVISSLYETTLMGTPLFERCSGECCKMLLMTLKPAAILATEVLIAKGENCDTLSFVVRGTLHVTLETPGRPDADPKETSPRKTTSKAPKFQVIERPRWCFFIRDL